MFWIHGVCKEKHTGKKCMFSPSYKPFRKQKLNRLFIKPDENFSWSLSVWMCCSAVKCKNNYVESSDYLIRVFFFFICVYEIQGGRYCILDYWISWLFVMQNKVRESHLLSCPRDQGHKTKKTVWSRSKYLFRSIQLALMSKPFQYLNFWKDLGC